MKRQKQIMQSAFICFAPRFPVCSTNSGFVSALQARPRNSALRIVTRACIPNHSTAESNSANNVSQDERSATQQISRTEQIAAMLGKSKESLEQSRDDVIRRDIKDKRFRYGAALFSVFAGIAAFSVQKLSLTSGASLLEYMYAHSDSPSVIGTNNKPTLIEFSTLWCTNCKASARGVFELENRYSGQVNFLVFNGDDPNNAEIIDKYGVDGVPQFSMIARDGSVKANLVGRIPRDVLAEDLDALLEERELPFPGLQLDKLLEAADG